MGGESYGGELYGGESRVNEASGTLSTRDDGWLCPSLVKTVYVRKGNFQ